MGLVESGDVMRLSLKKAAPVAMGGAARQEIPAREASFFEGMK
jgi:hypothetical protein